MQNFTRCLPGESAQPSTIAPSLAVAHTTRPSPRTEMMVTGSVTDCSVAETLVQIKHSPSQHPPSGRFRTSAVLHRNAQPRQEMGRAANPNCNSTPRRSELYVKPTPLHALPLQYQPASVTSGETENSLGWTQGGGKKCNKKIQVYLPRNLQPHTEVLHPPLWTFKYFNIKQMPLTYEEKEEIKVKVHQVL